MTLALRAMGGFGPTDGLFHDRASLLLPDRDFAEILVVRSAAGVPPDPTEVAVALSRLGARLLVLPERPSAPVEGSPSEIVVAGRYARPERSGATGWVLADPPVPGDPAWGAVVLPPLEAGVVRRLPTVISVDGTAVPTLPYATALAARVVDIPAPGESFLPRFPNSPAVLPSVDARRVLEGRVPAELVTGRIAVLAPPGDARLPGFATPAAPNVAALSLAELQAVAIDTLVSGSAITELGPVTSALLVIVAALGGLLLYVRIGPRHWPWAAVGVTTAILLASYAALRWADTLLPVSALLVSQVLLSLALWRGRELAEDRALRAMQRELAGRLRKVAAPAFEEAASRHAWATAAAMASRLLGLRRSLLLVPAPPSGPPGLEQVAGIGASLGDIPVDRRDPSGPPFSSALREGGPVEVERGFLACAESGETIYLTPLRSPTSAASTPAFWAFALPRGEAERLPALMQAVRAASEAMAEPAEDSLPGGKAKRLDAALWSDVDRLMARATTLAGVLEQISTAVVIFDPLGRVLHMNTRMSAAAEAAGLPAGAALAPPDLIAALGGLAQDQAARLVRRVLLDRVAVELTTSRAVGGRRHLLRLAVATRSGEAAAPAALLCELVDVTEPLRLAEIQRSFAEHVGMRLRNEVEAIGLGAGLLEDGRLPAAARARVSARLRGALNAIRGTVDAAESFMTFEVGGPELRTYPVDVLAALRAATDEAAAAAVRRRCGVELTAPEIAGLALAEPGALAAALEAMLLLLVEDAREGSQVKVAMEEHSDAIRIRAGNHGFGMPPARLQAVLSGEEAASSAELGALREAARAAAAWGGALEAEARSGEGFSLVLTLQRLF